MKTVSKLRLACVAALMLAANSAWGQGQTLSEIPTPATIIFTQNADGTYSPVGPTNRLQATTSAQTPLGYQQITSLSSAVGLTVPTGATACLVQAETQSVRWRDDGTNPTASVGTVISASTPGIVFVGSASLAAVRFIETTTSAKLNVSCYK